MSIPVRLPGLFRLFPLFLIAFGLPAGCAQSPLAEERAVAGEEPAPTARSTEDTQRPPLRLCERIWSEAQADSIWNCPDPTPPSAP